MSDSDSLYSIYELCFVRPKIKSESSWTWLNIKSPT